VLPLVASLRGTSKPGVAGSSPAGRATSFGRGRAAAVPQARRGARGGGAYPFLGGGGLPGAPAFAPWSSGELRLAGHRGHLASGARPTDCDAGAAVTCDISHASATSAQKLTNQKSLEIRRIRQTSEPSRIAVSCVGLHVTARFAAK
jgi:hypothetical protein